MAGPVNIAFGISAGSFQTGLDKMGLNVTQFTSLTRSQFAGLRNIGATPAGSIGQITAQLGIAQRSVNPLVSNLGKLGSSSSLLSPLTGALGGLFAVDKLRGFAAEITGASGKAEKFGSILTNALQSGSGAKDQLRSLTDFAANTPNQLDELTGSFIKFVNRGLVPSKQQLTNFGDLAASQGKGFDQLTEAILDAQSGEFERLKEFGVRASKSGDSVTLSFKGVTQTVKGTSEEITGAIQKFGQLTGVAGSMSAVAQTQEGIVSNLGDQYDRLLVALGQNGVSGGYRLALSAASSFLGVITDLIATSPVEDPRNQKTEINGLVGAIALANDNESLRLSLIQTLSQKYPEFLGKLDAESASTDLLARRLADVNTQYDKKIRIAQGEEKIKKATEDVTSAIRIQQDALEQLALASGKSLPELEKLTSKQRIELAKQIADRKKLTEFRPSYFGQSAGTSFDYVPGALEAGAAKQKKAQDELNKLMGDNATRQADLTKTTVDGYKAQIAQIQQKISLHKIDAKLGAEEITRLNEQIRVASGKPAVIKPSGATSDYSQLKADVDAAKDKIQNYVATHGVNAKIPANLQLEYKNKAAALKAADDAVKEITPKTPKASTAVASVQATGDLAILKRYAADLETTIQNLGGKAPEKLIQKLNDARSAIESLQALAAKDQKVNITGLKELAGPGSDARVAGVVDQMGKLAAILPGLNSAKPYFGLQLTDLQKLMPGVEFYQAKIAQIQQDIQTITLKGLAVPKEALESLTTYTTAMAAAQRAATQAQGKADNSAEENRLDSLPVVANLGIFKVYNDNADTALERTKNLREQITGSIRGAAADTVGAFGEWIGGLAAGTASLAQFPVAIGRIFGGLAKSMGQAFITFGTAGLAAKSLISNPITAIVAGVALVALGGALEATLSKQIAGIGNYAKGGLFTGSSVIRVAESARAISGGGEWVSPVGLGADLISDRIMKNLKLSEPKVNPINYQNLNRQQQSHVFIPDLILDLNVLRVAFNRSEANEYYFR